MGPHRPRRASACRLVPTRRHRVLPPSPAGDLDRHAISPDSGTHWTEPGAWPVAPGVHRIPLPLPDGRAAGGQRLRRRDRRRAHPASTAAGPSTVVRDRCSRQSLEDSARERRRHPALPGHPRAPRPLHAGRRRSDASSASHVGLGIGEQADPRPAPRRDRTATTRTCDCSPRAGAPTSAAPWRRRSPRARPPTCRLWDYPDDWLEGDHRRSTVGDRATRRRPHARPHGGPLRLRRPRRRRCCSPVTTCCRRSRRRSGSSRRSPTSPLGDFLALADQVRAAARPHAAARRTARSRPVARPGRRAPAHHDTARACASPRSAAGARTAFDVAGVLPWTRHEHTLVDLDVFNAALATLETRAHLELLVARGALGTPSRTASSSTGLTHHRHAERRRPRRTPGR